MRKKLNRPTRVRAPPLPHAGLPSIAAKVFGYTSCSRPELKDDPGLMGNRGNGCHICLAVVTELCPHGNLEDFMEREGVPLSTEVKLDVMLQVAKGLEQLKDARIVWRDLKAKNLLVRSAHRGRAGEVVKVSIAFTDWGTAVKMPEEGKRRMTLHGPGTAGYIAPDTRGPIYDYRADMWAYLVWAASMCLKVECIVDCQLEEALADLKLEKKASATSAQDTKVNELLRKFQADGKVDEGCDDLYELVRDSAPWVDASMRWSPEEAEEELTTFRADHGLVIDASAVQKEAAAPEPERRFKASCLLLDREYGRRLEAEYEANKLLREQQQHQHQHQPTSTSAATEPAPPAVRNDTVEKDDNGESDWDEEAPTQPIAPTQPAPETADEMDVVVEEEEEETPRGEERPANVAAVVVEPFAKKIDPYEFDLPEPVELDTSREMDASRETAFEAIAGTEDEASDEEDEASDEEDDEDDEDDEDEDEEDEIERAAQREADAVAGEWVGARVKKWFRLPKPRGRRKKGAPPPPDGEYVWGTVVETRARRMTPSQPHVPCAFVRYDDGDEEDMTLDECARWLARDRGASKDAAAVKSKRAAPGEVGKAAGKRPALGKISVNARRGRDEKKRKSGGSDVSLALTIRTPPSGAGSSGGGKKRGRAAPAFAVTAVDERGVVLGCSKCRYGRYGCATCRERAGVFETAVALILDDAKELERNKENEESERGGRRGVGAAPAAKRARRAPLSAVNDERVSRATAKAKAAEAPSARLRGSDANAKAKARKPSAKASAVDALAVVDASPKPAPAPVTAAEALAQCLLPIDVEDDFNEETLASKLPPGVALGCSKCRHNWRGCGVCRKRAGVWLPPSRAWRKRRGLDDAGGGGGGGFGFLALPAPGDAAFVAA